MTITWIARAALVEALCFSAGGCAAPAIGLGAAAEAAQIPTWITVANDIATGVKTLTEVEQLACTAQTMANSVHDATASYYWGLGCQW